LSGSNPPCLRCVVLELRAHLPSRGIPPDRPLALGARPPPAARANGEFKHARLRMRAGGTGRDFGSGGEVGFVVVVVSLGRRPAQIRRQGWVSRCVLSVGACSDCWLVALRSGRRREGGFSFLEAWRSCGRSFRRSLLTVRPLGVAQGSLRSGLWGPVKSSMWASDCRCGHFHRSSAWMFRATRAGPPP